MTLLEIRCHAGGFSTKVPKTIHIKTVVCELYNVRLGHHPSCPVYSMSYPLAQSPTANLQISCPGSSFALLSYLLNRPVNNPFWHQSSQTASSNTELRRMGAIPGLTRLATRNQNTTFPSYTPEPENLPYPAIEIGLGVLGIFVVMFFGGLSIWWCALRRRPEAS